LVPGEFLMNVDEARRVLSGTSIDDDEDPVVVPTSILAQLSKDDLPDGGSFQLGVLRDGIYHLDWSGRLRRSGDRIVGEPELSWTRKYWYAPIGLEQYMDLVRRAVETRQRVHGDVEVAHYDDDGAYVHLSYLVQTTDTNLGRAFDSVRKVCSEVEEAAQQAADDVGKRLAEVAARLSGWGTETLDVLVNKVETAASTDDKGRSLEELSARLFETINGLSVTGRIRTATEEIDLSVLNDSLDPRLRRESALLLVECKNWSGKCGKDEFVIFREKLENRNRRCSLGFLIAWNGFTGTVSKEMLRGSRDETLIVPITGQEIRAAVRDGDFSKILLECWTKAVSL
jgi:hypothetical protein